MFAGVFLFGGIKMKNPFTSLTKTDWILWVISMIVVITANLLSKGAALSTVLATLTGVTALVFLAGGNVWGQVLTVVFSILYSITSFQFHYWGEIITYLGMSGPIAAMSVISWLRHPYREDKNEVKIHYLTAFQTILMIVLSALVTTAFYFVLKHFETPNLFFSTLSITTSFLASYLMFFRCSYYALAYAANDIVLIILWILAAITNIAYLPMIMCFVMFLVNDVYGFICWKMREKKQAANL